MSEVKYSTRIEKENIAKVYGRSVNISTKQAIEICNFIRGKTTEKAKKQLQDAIDMKHAIPLKRFGGDTGHRKGMQAGPGRYIVKAAATMKGLIESAEANAQFKGLEVKNLVIAHACAQRAAQQWRYGRHYRRKMKNSHVEIIVEESKVEKKGAAPKKEEKKAVKATPEVKKVEAKPVEKKPEVAPKKEVVKPVETPKKPVMAEEVIEKKEEKKIEPKMKKEEQKAPVEKKAVKPEEKAPEAEKK